MDSNKLESLISFVESHYLTEVQNLQIQSLTEEDYRVLKLLFSFLDLLNSGNLIMIAIRFFNEGGINGMQVFVLILNMIFRHYLIEKLIKSGFPLQSIMLVNSFIGIVFSSFPLFTSNQHIDGLISMITNGILHLLFLGFSKASFIYFFITIAYGQAYLYRLISMLRQVDEKGEAALLTTSCSYLILNGLIFGCLFFNNRTNNKINSELKNALKELEEALKAKDIFFATMSHELRNPLNSLIGCIELLSSDSSTLDKETLRTASSCGDILAGLINNLLDASKLQADKLEIEYAPCNIRETLQKVFDASKGQSRVKGIDLQLRVKDNMPKWIETDQNRLSQILINLVGNAIKFTDSGKVVLSASWVEIVENRRKSILENSELSLPSVTPTGTFEELMSADMGTIEADLSAGDNEDETWTKLSDRKINEHKTIKDIPWHEFRATKGKSFVDSPISLEINNIRPARDSFMKLCDFQNSLIKEEKVINGILKIQIIDTGIGLKPDDVPKLFQPFCQAQDTASNSFGGTGLGLWISKCLLNKMGGDIKVKSVEGKGSDFICILPVKTTIPTQLHHSHKISNQKLKVLFLEDLPFNQKVIKGVLERQNMEVYIANNGADGLQIFQRYEFGFFDLIITDLDMPVMGGEELIQKLRAYEASKGAQKRIEIAVLSAKDVQHGKDRCMKLGANHYWNKPLKKENVQNLALVLRRRVTYGDTKIVIVDDDTYCAKITQKFLEEEGFATRIFRNSTAALEVLRKEYQSTLMLIVDAEMPGLSGYDLASHIRTFETENSISTPLHILCISGHTSSNHFERVQLSGINKTLIKPIKKSILIRQVDKILA